MEEEEERDQRTEDWRTGVIVKLCESKKEKTECKSYTALLVC